MCVWINDFVAKKTPPPSLKKLMRLRLIKTVGSTGLFIAGLLLDKSTVVPFLLVFALFYIAYSIIETKLMLIFSKAP
jgi:hypothetical protein